MRENVFGKILKQKRKEAGYSQQLLAEKSHLNRSFIGQLERGSASPTLNTLAKIAKALNVRCCQMLREVERLANHSRPSSN